MDIHIIRQHATQKEIREMLQELETYIKPAVDVERKVLAGRGKYHADCEEALMEDGNLQENVWAADGYLDSKPVAFGALINIRPDQGNPGMEIQNPNQIPWPDEKLDSPCCEDNSLKISVFECDGWNSHHTELRHGIEPEEAEEVSAGLPFFLNERSLSVEPAYQSCRRGTWF